MCTWPALDLDEGGPCRQGLLGVALCHHEVMCGREVEGKATSQQTSRFPLCALLCQATKFLPQLRVLLMERHERLMVGPRLRSFPQLAQELPREYQRHCNLTAQERERLWLLAATHEINHGLLRCLRHRQQS